MARQYILPADSDLQPCPMDCGRFTEDVAGGPCTACWQKVFAEARNDVADLIDREREGERIPQGLMEFRMR